MIDPKELRIGNLIYNQSVVVAANGSTIFDLAYFEKPQYQPIPITPEWLERLGFEKRESSTCTEYHIGINDVTHDWLFSLTWLLRPELIKAPDYPFYLNGRHTLFYVHQVQNLYYALTGTELALTK